MKTARRVGVEPRVGGAAMGVVVEVGAGDRHGPDRPVLRRVPRRAAWDSAVPREDRFLATTRLKDPDVRPPFAEQAPARQQATPTG